MKNHLICHAKRMFFIVFLFLAFTGFLLGEMHIFKILNQLESFHFTCAKRARDMFAKSIQLSGMLVPVPSQFVADSVLARVVRHLGDLNKQIQLCCIPHRSELRMPVCEHTHAHTECIHM